MPDHTLRVTIERDRDTREPIIAFDMMLSAGPWYRRLWYGLKYILGIKSPYGYFGECVLSEEDVKRLVGLLKG
jgi:hypothetical protein